MPSDPDDRRLARWVRRAAGVAIGSLLAGSAAVTVAQQAHGIGPWWLELSRYLPYPVLLAPGALGLFAGAWLGRGWRLASLAVLTATATLGMGLAWGGPDAGAGPLRFMTWNIKAYKAVKRGDGFTLLAREIAAQAPELLVVQDNQGPGVFRFERRLWPDGRPFGYPYAFVADQYIVASRHPLHECALLAPDPRRPISTALRCTVEVRGRALTVMTTHFDSPRDGLNATRRDGLDGAEDWEQNRADRLEQSRRLAAFLQDTRRPLILAGDLNAPEASQVVRTLTSSGLRDAWSSAMRGWGYSYGQALRFIGFSFLRIDHVLVSPEIGVAGCRVGTGAASDHRPVVCDLWLERR